VPYAGGGLLGLSPPPKKKIKNLKKSKGPAAFYL